MNKKGLMALALVVLIPVICYTIVKVASERVVIMPKHYFPDTVISAVKDGKTVTDTVWHSARNITLVNQLGDTVSLHDIKNKVIICNFIFTHCGGICPVMTKNMQKLQSSFANYREGRKVIDSSIVHFLSFSIDPERDTVQQLKDYADRFGVNHDNWWLMTGNKKDIYDFIFEEFKVDKYSDEPIDSNFVHTNKFVLLDRNYTVRGFYNGLDSSSLSILAQDVGKLMLEKDKKVKSTLFTKIVNLTPLWLVIVTLTIMFFVYFNSKRNKEA
jgi:protein SCO1/2